MISHIIMHYNRPWLLKTHIDLIRKYSPSISQIVVADDGSDDSVIKYIKRLPIDNLYVQKNHSAIWDKNSSSNTFISAVEMCKHAYISFSEDDFFLWPSGIDDSSFYNNGEYPSDLLVDGPDPFADSVHLFSIKGTVMVQPSRDSTGWKGVPVTDVCSSGVIKWNKIDHAKKKTFYYSNWPWIMRSSFLKCIDIPKDIGMWGLESSMNKILTKKFKNIDFNWCADKRRFVHVGLPFSHKDMRYKEKTDKAQIRNDQSKSFVLSLENQIDFSNINGFNKKFLRLWLKNNVDISISELQTIGIKKSFESFAKKVLL